MTPLPLGNPTGARAVLSICPRDTGRVWVPHRRAAPRMFPRLAQGTGHGVSLVSVPRKEKRKPRASVVGAGHEGVQDTVGCVGLAL